MRLCRGAYPCRQLSMELQHDNNHILSFGLDGPTNDCGGHVASLAAEALVSMRTDPERSY